MKSLRAPRLGSLAVPALSVVALFLSTTTAAYVLSALPLGHDQAHRLGMLVALVSSFAGFGWLRAYAFGLPIWEPFAWVLGFRVVSILIPFDPQGLLALGFAAISRALVARRRSIERPAIQGVAAFFILLTLAILAGHAAERRRLAPANGHRWCLSDGPSPVVSLGDSSTYGMFVASDLTYVSHLGAVACAEPGASSTNIASQAEDARTLSPRAITVLIGPNDRFNDQWRESLKANLQQLIKTQHANGQRVYLLTYPFGSLLRPRWIDDLNDIIHVVGREQASAVIDVERHLRNDFFSFLLDDVHPSPRGHRKIAELIRQSICPASPAPAACSP